MKLNFADKHGGWELSGLLWRPKKSFQEIFFLPCFSLFSFFKTLEAFYSSMELSHVLTTCQMILAPSLIWVIFWVSEFQGKLTTPGNSVLTRCSFIFLFPNSDEFSPLKCGGRGSVMFSAKNKFRKSHGHLGNFQYEGKIIGLKTKSVICVQ